MCLANQTSRRHLLRVTLEEETTARSPRISTDRSAVNKEGGAWRKFSLRFMRDLCGAIFRGQIKEAARRSFSGSYFMSFRVGS